MTARVLTRPVDAYQVSSHFVVRDRHESWPDDREITLAVRRVIREKGSPHEREELQIEVEILVIHKKSGRHSRACSTLCAPPAVADEIARACAEVRS